MVFNETDHPDYSALLADKRGQEARVSAIQQQLGDEKLSDEEKKTLREDLSSTHTKIEEIEGKLKEIYSSFGEEHKIISQLIDLGLLSSGLLKGKALDSFVTRSMELLSRK